jgi:putative tricarboxylic transport membrane protein
VVAAGIIGLGLWLGFEAFSGGWRNAAPDDPSERGEHAFNAAAFAWISAGLFAHMALIGWAGFVIAGTALFACIARGFGSRRLIRDLSIGIVLALAVFLFFVKLLNVNLPAGWLSPLLGGAGI